MIAKSALNSSIMTFVPLLLVLFDFVLSAVSVCVLKTTLKLRKARGFLEPQLLTFQLTHSTPTDAIFAMAGEACDDS